MESFKLLFRDVILLLGIDFFIVLPLEPTPSNARTKHFSPFLRLFLSPANTSYLCPFKFDFPNF